MPNFRTKKIFLLLFQSLRKTHFQLTRDTYIFRAAGVLPEENVIIFFRGNLFQVIGKKKQPNIYSPTYFSKDRGGN